LLNIVKTKTKNHCAIIGIWAKSYSQQKYTGNDSIVCSAVRAEILVK